MRSGLIGGIIIAAIVVLFVLSMVGCMSQSIKVDSADCPNPKVVLGKLICNTSIN